MGNKRSRNKAKEVEHVLNVLSNQPEGWKYDLLQMILEGAINNQIGYMDALNKTSGEAERLLVGIELTNDGQYLTYPLARLLETDEVTNYLAPDGFGGWGGTETSESSERVAN
jgi:hypothetical protein